MNLRVGCVAALVFFVFFDDFVKAEPLTAQIPWEVIRDDAQLKIWQRVVPGSDIREVRVEIELAASSVRIWEVIRDLRSHREFLPYVREARILSESSPRRRVYYQRISPPMVSDRDYTVQAEAWADYKTGVFEQVFEIAPERGPAPIDAVVRVTEIRGRWLLEPLPNGHTRIAYWVHADPGGAMPAWLVNFGQRYSVPQIFAAIEKRALDPNYRR